MSTKNYLKNSIQMKLNINYSNSNQIVAFHVLKGLGVTMKVISFIIMFL